MTNPLRTLALAALAAGCVTVNVYFPEGEIRDLSHQIEEEIRRQAEEEGSRSSGESDPQSPRRASLFERGLRATGGLLFGAPVYAQERVAEPEVTNPAIRRIIESRARRLEEINRFKSEGVVGESNQAILEIRNLEAVTDLRQRAALQRVVRDENADREQLFKEIAAATAVDLSQLQRIRQTYAQTLRDGARPGDWIQMPDDSWRQK